MHQVLSIRVRLEVRVYTIRISNVLELVRSVLIDTARSHAENTRADIMRIYPTGERSVFFFLPFETGETAVPFRGLLIAKPMKV